MKVLVLHTLPPERADAGRDVGEFDLGAAADSIAAALPHAMPVGVRGEVREVLRILGAHRPDVVFNACEAPLGRPELEAHVAALLEWLGLRFTGARSDTLALCRRKDRVNAVLPRAGVPVPRTGVFPCVVKPADEDGSAGIHADSVCHDPEAVRRARARLRGPVVVEEFLPGREFAVALWGRVAPVHVSIGETCFEDGLRLNTYAAKWEPESPDFARSPLRYDEPLASALREAVVSAATGAWDAVGARHYLRVDVRVDADGVPRVLDVNPNPELGPGVGIHRAVEAIGWTWERFVRQLVEWT